MNEKKPTPPNYQLVTESCSNCDNHEYLSFEVLYCKKYEMYPSKCSTCLSHTKKQKRENDLQEKIKLLEEERDYWKGCYQVLEKEKSEYYQAFDSLAEELGVFNQTDPGKPKKSFKVISKTFKDLKEKLL